MIVRLLDVNVLISLLDSAHEHHLLSRAWFRATASVECWATSPITENLAILTGSRQTTDSYLAGLAFRKKGRLATLDGRVAWRSVRGARPDLIEKIVD